MEMEPTDRLENTVKQRRLETACAELIEYTLSWNIEDSDDDDDDDDDDEGRYGDESIPFPDEVWTYRNLKKLTIQHCPHSRLPPEISNLTELTELHLYHVRFTELISSLAQLPKLKKLIVDTWSCDERRSHGSNPLSSIGRLQTLTTLAFRNVDIPYLPPSLFELTSLKQFETERNTFCIPEEFGNLINLEYFHCDDCSLPSSICNLTNLRVLHMDADVDSPNLELPLEIGNLIGLESLRLKYGRFRGESRLRPLPLGMMTNLKSLELHRVDNSALLPQDIGNLKNLETLKLLHCEAIDTLPRSLCELVSLKHLEIASSSICDLPEDIGNLVCLEHLSLRLSNTFVLPRSVGDLARLKFLCIKDTRLSTLPDEIGNLINLENLYLDNSCGAFLPVTVKYLSNLKGLGLLGYSKLVNSFPVLPHLTELEVTGLIARKNFFSQEIVFKTTFRNSSWSASSSLESLSVAKCWLDRKCRSKILSSLPSSLNALTLKDIPNMLSLDEIKRAEFPRRLRSLELSGRFVQPSSKNVKMHCIQLLLAKYQHLCHVDLYNCTELSFHSKFLLSFNRCGRYLLHRSAESDGVARSVPLSLWPLVFARVRDQVINVVDADSTLDQHDAVSHVLVLEASLLYRFLQGPAFLGR